MSTGIVPTSASPAPRAGVLATVRRLGVLGVQATLLVSPWPTAMLLRYMFKKGASERAVRQLAEAPRDVVAFLDERYDPNPDALLDVYVPGQAMRSGAALPVVVWVHGGAFVGGSKDELGGYLRMLAARGFCVAGVGYTLAPEGRYPTPVRQVMAALNHLQGHCARLHADPARVVLAGDSAGAQIAAQVAALVSNPEYVAQLGVSSTVEPSHLRGVALCCGIYDLSAVRDRGPFKDLISAVGWAYSGHRHFRQDSFFVKTASVPGFLTTAFPPAFVTAGHVDPLLPQSLAFTSALKEKTIEVETLFYEEGHQPALGHEYQFDLDLADGLTAFERLVAFFGRCTADNSV
jgi:acetyl esterase